jgi:hypothetical protein
VIRRLLVICLFGAFLMVAVAPAQPNGGTSGKRGGFLFIGTDAEEFGGAVSADRLGRFQTRGPNVVGGGIIATAFLINGMTNAHGFLYSGDPRSNVIRRISYDGSLLGSTVAGIPAVCCSEDMILDGRFLYHAHHPSTIEKINAATGALVHTYAQPNVVGMTFVTNDNDDEDDNDDGHHEGKKFARFDLTQGVRLFDHGDNDDEGDDRQIWITKWSARQVGTWDPATNIFTPRFTTPQNAGGLAWDPGKKVLWVGLGGGLVVPYHLNGTPYNAGFRPFGPIADTIDGLEFVRKIHHHGKHHNDH